MVTTLLGWHPRTWSSPLYLHVSRISMKPHNQTSLSGPSAEHIRKATSLSAVAMADIGEVYRAASSLDCRSYADRTRS